MFQYANGFKLDWSLSQLQHSAIEQNHNRLATPLSFGYAVVLRGVGPETAMLCASKPPPIMNAALRNRRRAPNCSTRLAVSLPGDTTISNKNKRLQKTHGSLSPINDNPAVNLGERCFQLLDL